MNVLVCALSGQSPIPDPVVTPTGQICSKKILLQKLLETNYTNPFTTTSTTSNPMPLDESQLIDIQTTSSNSNNSTTAILPTTSNSIPSILNQLSSEYTSLILELYDTRKALQETRQELSVALYQNDAAIRVIARVVLERDLVKKQLADLVSGTTTTSSSKRKRGEDDQDNAEETNVGSKNDLKKVNVVMEEDHDVQMQDDTPTTTPTSTTTIIPIQHSQQLQTKWNELFTTRKHKMKSGSNYLSSLDQLLSQQSSSSPTTMKKYHKSTNKGILSLISPLPIVSTATTTPTTDNDTNDIIVTSGKNDKQIIWYNKKHHQIMKKMTIKKPTLYCHMYNNVTAFITTDNILHVVINDNGMEEATLVLDNDDSIGLCVHPTCEHVFVCTSNGNIQIVHLNKNSGEDGRTLTLEMVAILKGLSSSGHDNGNNNDDKLVKCTCMGLHPDGLILALGRNDGKINIWDLKTEKLASILEVSYYCCHIFLISFLHCFLLS